MNELDTYQIGQKMNKQENVSMESPHKVLNIG